MCRKVLPALAICAVVLLALPACADIDFGGYARSSAMGGAGLAVLDDPMVTALINPAAMALVPKRFTLQYPSFTPRYQGQNIPSLQDIQDIMNIQDVNEATDLLKGFLREPTQLGLDTRMGVSWGTGSIGLGGQLVARLEPSEALGAWAKDGIVPPDLADATAMVSGDAIAFVPFSMGWKIPRAKGEMYVGALARWVRSIHYEQQYKLEVDPDPANPVNIVKDGPETNVEDSGFGMDIGMIMRADGPRETTYGLVITNLLNPNLSGIDQSSMVSLGFATKPLKRVIVAADLVNIFKGYGESPKLRMGAEFKVAKRIALRAGYSGSSFTYGFGLFGLNLAFSSEMPMTIAQTLRF